MDVNIINNRNSTILKLLDEDNNDKSINLKILNIFFHKNNLNIENEYNNLSLYNLKLDDVFINSIDYDFEFFDYIIFSDTIEKLLNPLEFLKKLKLYLKPNGSIIATIPNIMHVTVIKDIINGKFNSSKVSQLDNSNIKFFTLHEIKRIFIESGYNLKYILSISTNLSDGEKALVDSLVSLSNPESKLGFNSYEYLIKGTIQNSKTLYDYVINS